MAAAANPSANSQSSPAAIVKPAEEQQQDVKSEIMESKEVKRESMEDVKEVKKEPKEEPMEVKKEPKEEPIEDVKDVKKEPKEEPMEGFNEVKEEPEEEPIDDMDEKEDLEKFQRYEADFKQYLISKYFSDKTITGGNIYDVKTNIGGETIAASRQPPYQSFADPKTFLELVCKKPSSSEDTPTTSTSKGKPSTEGSRKN